MKLVISTMFILFFMASSVNAQDSLYIYKSGNIVYKSDVSTVDSITFSKSNYQPGIDTVDNGKEDYSSLTVEQHKQAIEEQGLQMMNKIDSLKYLQSVHVIKDFVDLMDQSSSPDMAPATKSFVKSFDGSKKMLAMKANTSLMLTIAQEFDKRKGVYTYDNNNNSWIKTESASEIKFVFPTASSSYNNASISLGNFSSIPSPNVVDLGGTYLSLVTSLKFAVTVNDLEELSFIFSGAYNANGLPTYLSETLAFAEGYKLNSTFVNTTSMISYDQYFRNSTSNIYTEHFDVRGNFDYSKFKDLSDSDASLQDIADVLNSANATYQVGNLRMVGLVDFKTLASEMTGEVNDESKNSIDSVVTAFNNNVTLYVKYVDANEVIAKSQFFTDTYTDSNYEYNPDTQSYELVETTKYEPGMRFVFQDGSALDGSFFDTGFEDLQTRVEDFGKAMEDSYQ